MSVQGVRDCPFSAREAQIVELLADGLTYPQIADRLGLQVSTVRTCIHHVYCKLGIHDRAQVVLACQRAGWLPDRAAGDMRVLTERLTAATERLADHLGSRREVPRSCRAYLKGLDRALTARTPREREQGRRTMADAMPDLLGDHRPSDRQQRRYNLLGRLIVEAINR